MNERPRIICLCGSSRFIEHFAIMAWLLEKGGAIVLGLHYLPPSYSTEAPDHLAEVEGVQAHFDELHKRKIDLADEIYVLNINGYIGESTRSEIDYAKAHGKPVYYFENLNHAAFYRAKLKEKASYDSKKKTGRFARNGG